MVPKGWEKVSLGEVFDFRNGINADKSQYGQGIKFVNVMDVFGHDVLTEPKIIGRISISEKKLDDNRLEYGDVLFNRTSETFDEIAMSAVYLDSADATFGGFVIRGRPLTNSLDPKYTVYAFQDSNFRKQVIKLGQGAIRANIGQKDLVKVELLVPPLPEQQKIAKILSTCDKAISTTERLIDNSTQQKKALMQQLLTGKKRLLDESGKRFKGEWEEVRLDEVVSIGRGHAFKSEQYSEYGYKIVRVTNIDSSGNIDLTDCVFIPENTAKEFSKYELKDEDILLVMVGATVGKLGFVDDSILPALLNQNMWSLRTSNSQILYQEFLKHISSYIIARYMLTQQGSARGFFTQSTFSLVKFSIPNIKEQQKIATVLTNADKEMELLEQQLADLQQEKKALMQVLLTGKKRVVVD